MALTGQHYYDEPWTDPAVLNGSMRFLADGTFAGVTVAGLTGVAGTSVLGPYYKFAGTVTTTGVATCYIPLPVPAIVNGRQTRVQEISFLVAKIDGDTGGGIVAGTNTWMTGWGLAEILGTGDTIDSVTTSIYSDTTNRLIGAQSATPERVTATGLDLARTAGAILVAYFQFDCNDEAVDFRIYATDNGYVRFTDRPPFTIT